MFSNLVYSSDIVVYIHVWKTFPRLLYLDERCDLRRNGHLVELPFTCTLLG